MMPHLETAMPSASVFCFLPMKLHTVQHDTVLIGGIIVFTLVNHTLRHLETPTDTRRFAQHKSARKCAEEAPRRHFVGRSFCNLRGKPGKCKLRFAHLEWKHDFARQKAQFMDDGPQHRQRMAIPRPHGLSYGVAFAPRGAFVSTAPVTRASANARA